MALPFVLRRVEDGRGGFRFSVHMMQPFRAVATIRLTMTPFPLPQYVVAEHY